MKKENIGYNKRKKDKVKEMKKRLTQKELREILLKNAKVLMSEKYKTEYQEISGEKKKEKE